jgi:di/tricarboxylate transporter
VKSLLSAISGPVNKWTDASPHRTFKEGDTLIIKANAEDLQELLEATGLKLAESIKFKEEMLSSDEITVMEATITKNSMMEGRTARSLKLRSRFGVNLLGVARQGGRLRSRPDSIRFKVGDVLLLQGSSDILQEVLPTLGLLPLVERGLRVGSPPRVYFALAIFGVALLLAATGVLAIQVAFVGAALIMAIGGLIPIREIYSSIDWAVIVLLGAMIPVSQAFEITGGARLVAEGILSASGNAAPWVTITLVLVGTMFLSDLVNNAAAAVLMAPVRSVFQPVWGPRQILS